MCYFEDCEDRYWPPEDNTPDCPCDCDNSTDTGNTNPGGSHICICNCDDCADGTCGITRYYKPGESFCLYDASHSDYYAWSTEPSIIFVGTDGKAVAIREGSAYICIRSRSNPSFRRCIRVVATNTPPITNPKDDDGNNHQLTEEEKMFIAVIAGEAGSEKQLAWECVAQIIMNRLNEKRDAWLYAENVTDIISDKSQFNAYEGKNYNIAMSYLDNRDGTHQKYEKMIQACLPYYYQIKDLSGLERVVLFFSPKSMGFVDDEKTIPRVPNYATSPKVEEVFLAEIDSDIFRFFRYK